MRDSGDHQGVLQSYDAFKARALMPNELILLSVIKALFSCQQHARAYVRVLLLVAICLCHASYFGCVRASVSSAYYPRSSAHTCSPSTNCAWQKQPASSSRKGFAVVLFEVHFDSFNQWLVMFSLNGVLVFAAVFAHEHQRRIVFQVFALMCDDGRMMHSGLNASDC